jgi:hypothetical protein
MAEKQQLVVGGEGVVSRGFFHRHFIWVMVIMGLLFLSIGFCWWFFLTRTPANNLSNGAEDEFWLPDAVVESEDRVLEMKFGN